MVGRPHKEIDLLTEAELELMNVLWELGDGTARQVLEALPENRRRAYTSVATILHVLDEKGFAASTLEGRVLRYRPALSKAAYQAKQLRSVVATLFDGDALSLVRRLIDATPLRAEELRALRELIDADADAEKDR